MAWVNDIYLNMNYLLKISIYLELSVSNDQANNIIQKYLYLAIQHILLSVHPYMCMLLIISNSYRNKNLNLCYTYKAVAIASIHISASYQRYTAIECGLDSLQCCFRWALTSMALIDVAAILKNNTYFAH